MSAFELGTVCEERVQAPSLSRRGFMPQVESSRKSGGFIKGNNFIHHGYKGVCVVLIIFKRTQLLGVNVCHICNACPEHQTSFGPGTSFHVEPREKMEMGNLAPINLNPRSIFSNGSTSQICNLADDPSGVRASGCPHELLSKTSALMDRGWQV